MLQRTLTESCVEVAVVSSSSDIAAELLSCS